MHTLDEFKIITDEVIKKPQNLTDITKETVELVEESLKKETLEREKDELEGQGIER